MQQGHHLAVFQHFAIASLPAKSLLLTAPIVFLRHGTMPKKTNQ